MTLHQIIARIATQEDLNFLLTNRLPRRAATRFLGWFSKIEQPIVRSASIAVWRFFSDVDMSDAAETRFRSMHACFIRALKPGARPVDPDPDILASPSDAIVGACGRIDDGVLHQIKGFPYTLTDLMGDAAANGIFANGTYVTLRLTAGMYHRLHAPHDLTVEEVTYISGDTWNVNPIALKRVEKLFCKNERALIRTRLDRGGHPLMLVPVAAILVASIRLHCIGIDTPVREGGARKIPCDAHVTKGEEMGWFEHGSTIIVFAPESISLCEGIEEGSRIRAGQPLMRLPT